MQNIEQKPSARIIKMPSRTMAAPAEASSKPGPISYYDHIVGYAQKIRESHDTAEIIRLLDEALTETHSLYSLNELAMARRQVADAESKISALKSELEEVSGLLREDSLTGAINRRGLEEIYARESARSDRRGTPLCVVLLDLDNFKTINDTHGHSAGDTALIELTQTARTTLRPNDSIARIGGEEFVLLLPDTDLDSALTATNRLASMRDSTKISQTGMPVKITFSAGIALRNRDESMLDILIRADKALYAAKHAGKNRTEVASQ